MIWLFGTLSFLAGVLNTVQSGANNTLAKGLGQPVLAALVVTLVNGLTYLVFGAFYGIGWPRDGALATLPWWCWIGGALGGAYVLATIFFSEKLGAGVFIGLTVTAAIVTSVAMDHFGLVGFKQHTASWPRLIGAALMIGGLTLVSAF